MAICILLKNAPSVVNHVKEVTALLTGRASIHDVFFSPQNNINLYSNQCEKVTVNPNL